MSMVEWISRENKNSLILFVHGLKGGLDTWENSEGISFPMLLTEEEDIKDSFDVACFNYFTTFTQTYASTKGVLARILSRTKRKERNIPTDEIAELLYTEININLSNYERIIIIAHSMGGLISKNLILKKAEYEESSNIVGFISLAVPHSGAKIANIASLVSTNAQLVDLSLLSNATDDLNRRWINASKKLPVTRYIYGTYDSYVDKKSALPMDSERKNSFAVNDDHGSICKPENSQSMVFIAVKKFITEIDKAEPNSIVVERFLDAQQYDNEYFVLKMIVADIHKDIAQNAKEFYYNAELVRNIFTSDYDRKILSQLYAKIRTIYQEEYESHIADSISPDKFIAGVHARISREDKASLDTLIKSLDSVHKKGMLHQLANKNDRDIVWSSATCLKDLEKLKRVDNE
ncbi:GPI inositol-deacylase [Buttiauxella sp. A2-C1_F]|uniref:ABC-three component system protein n=1 Tax=Buttiauxella sp. A2-C1_F TaxID=2904526 RepID=UPI001E3F5C51|nr:ABC-three component system protein [Buttiauxella sp. A2-C1_F]MCE0845168.1 GPI inositol-deacylase [Buttiauxella sp. A2-C1_F]